MTELMQTLTTISDMQTWAQDVRSRGERIAFVPTMGCLHEGHCSLLRAGRACGDRLVLSLFVNPTQFGPNEDFARYPRTFEADLEKARDCGVDVVFHPDVEEMYPKSDRPEPVEGQIRSWFDGLTTNGASDLSGKLCGKFRPGHFRGVATVVVKLFQIVQPHVALLGEKDYQQLQIIRRMVADLNIPVEIKGYPIVREPDGLAMSSRNTYLSPEERRRALSLYEGLLAAQALVRQGETSPIAITATARQPLEAADARIDYVSLADTETLEPLTYWKTPSVLAIAAWIGQTRLIDNTTFR